MQDQMRTFMDAKIAEITARDAGEEDGGEDEGEGQV